MKVCLKNENEISIVKDSHFEMDCLKPPLDANLINHPQDYIYGIDKKGKHLRRIFYNQEFSEFERGKIQEFRQLFKENNVQLPSEWSDLKILKYIYNEQFNKKDFINQIKKHIEWLQNDALQNPSQETLDKYLKSGVMYTFGHDNQYRPIVYVNSYMINADSNNIDDMNALNGALCRLLSIVQKNMFLEGKVENWIICIDTNTCGLTQIDFKVIGKIIECMVANYTCILHKLYILNPSWIFTQCWKIISAFIPSDTQNKIEFLTKSQFHKFVEQGIEKDQLEQKYGGDHEDLKQFWPPKQKQQNNLNNIGDKFVAPSILDSSHYHSMIDHSHFISRSYSQKEINDQEQTQDGMNFYSKNILEEKQFTEKIQNNQQLKQKGRSSLQAIDNQLEQPHAQSTGGCCSQNSCQIF